ncbi:unnamed protein product [Fusarium fujikuroi]|nr:unnamed protein product [Fusarium fujikuroi]
MPSFSMGSQIHRRVISRHLAINKGPVLHHQSSRTKDNGQPRQTPQSRCLQKRAIKQQTYSDNLQAPTVLWPNPIMFLPCSAQTYHSDLSLPSLGIISSPHAALILEREKTCKLLGWPHTSQQEPHPRREELNPRPTQLTDVCHYPWGMSMFSVSLETQEKGSELSTIDVLQGKCLMLPVFWHPEVSFACSHSTSLISASLERLTTLTCFQILPPYPFSTPTDISFERNQAPLLTPTGTHDHFPRRYLRCAPAQLQSHRSVCESSLTVTL